LRKEGMGEEADKIKELREGLAGSEMSGAGIGAGAKDEHELAAKRKAGGNRVRMILRRKWRSLRLRWMRLQKRSLMLMPRRTTIRCSKGLGNEADEVARISKVAEDASHGNAKPEELVRRQWTTQRGQKCSTHTSLLGTAGYV
jgi:hypothetical protein